MERLARNLSHDDRVVRNGPILCVAVTYPIDYVVKGTSIRVILQRFFQPSPVVLQWGDYHVASAHLTQVESAMHTYR